MCWNEHLLWTFPSVYSSYSSLSKAPSFSLICSQDGVASEVGDAAEVATVTCHQDVSLVAPFLTPAVKKRQKMESEMKRWRRWNIARSQTAFQLIILTDDMKTTNNQHLILVDIWDTWCHSDKWHVPPVLDNPVLLPLGVHSIAYCQHGMIDVIFVTVGIVVNTWVHDRETKSCISEQCINYVPRTIFNVEYNRKLLMCYV